jgi:uncharacterized membrane protein (UPF0136 family)
MDKRLSWMVVAYGLLVIAGGIIGYASAGSRASLWTAVPLGTATTVFGVFLLRGARWALRAGFFSCAAVAAVMIERLVSSGKIMPAVPVAALGLGLAFLLLRKADAPP